MTEHELFVQTLAKPTGSFDGTGCQAQAEDAPQGESRKRVAVFSLSPEARALPLSRPRSPIRRFHEVWR